MRANEKREAIWRQIYAFSCWSAENGHDPNGGLAVDRSEGPRGSNSGKPLTGEHALIYNEIQYPLDTVLRMLVSIGTIREPRNLYRIWEILYICGRLDHDIRWVVDPQYRLRDDGQIYYWDRFEDRHPPNYFWKDRPRYDDPIWKTCFGEYSELVISILIDLVTPGGKRHYIEIPKPAKPKPAKQIDHYKDLKQAKAKWARFNAAEELYGELTLSEARRLISIDGNIHNLAPENLLIESLTTEITCPSCGTVREVSLSNFRNRKTEFCRKCSNKVRRRKARK